MKKNIDILHGSLPRGIVRFVLPLAATGILQQLFNAADIAVVGRFVGKEAMAAVGSNGALINLLINLMMGIAMGTNIVVATAIGRGDEKTVHKAVHTSIIISVLGGVFFAIVNEIFAIPILDLIAVPPEVIGMASVYLRIYFAGLPLIVLYNFEAAVFRSCGDTRTPLVALTASGVLNVVLNVFFVVKLNMGVSGVAIATVIANGFSAAALFIALVRTDKVIRFRKSDLRIDPAILQQILRIGVPTGIQGMVFSISNIILQAAINSLGTVCIAASAAALNIEILNFFMFNAFGQACSTFVSQNNGAGNIARCHRTLGWSFILGFLFTGTLAGLGFVFGKDLLALFNKDPQVIATGYIRVQILCATFPLSLMNELSSGYLRGYGVTHLPALCSVFGICGLRILWVSTVFRHWRTFTSLILVYPVTIGLTGASIAVAAYIYERRRGSIGPSREQ
ncbi:MAG: MATE family efflux transporter [Pyramidobacter sp.]|jgi:putative MATE family efflux protein